MSKRDFQLVERCWRRRRQREGVYPASRLPSLAGLGVRLSDDELNNLVFLHHENIDRLGSAITNSAGKTLKDLISEEKAGAFSFLPANASEALRGQRHADCAVLASGGGLQGASLGRQIDKHDFIVRINQAPTTNSKTNVGSKTSLRLINNLWTQTYAKANLKRSEKGASGTPLETNVTVYVTRPSADDYMKLVRRSRQSRRNVGIRLVSSRVVSLVRDGILTPFRDRMAEVGADELTVALLEGRNTPSSGLVAVFMMIQLCDRVTVYGFSGFNDGKYHYWKSNRQYQNRTHSFSVERALLRRLAHEGFLTFVEGNLHNIKSFV